MSKTCCRRGWVFLQQKARTTREINRYPIIRQAASVLKSTIKAWKINGFPLAIGFYLLGKGVVRGEVGQDYGSGRLPP